MVDELVVRGTVIPAHELHWSFSRASGPGGQGVNTTDSRVQLTFDLASTPSISEPLKMRAIGRLSGRLVNGCLVVAASEHRSQLLNREEAQRRLAGILDRALAPPPKKRRPTKPSKAAVDRRIKAKKNRGQVKRLRRTHDDG